MPIAQSRRLIVFTLLCAAPAGLLVTTLHAERRSAGASVLQDSRELARLFEEDQDDRQSEPIDPQVVVRRDAARLARVGELLAQGRLRSGADYYHAAMIYQHSTVTDDYLLAHELSVVAVGLGYERAKWLAAATEDRFLMNLGRPQRFGTQYRSEKSGPMRLYPVDPAVTDGLRRALKVPSIAEARQREAEMNRKVEAKP